MCVFIYVPPSPPSPPLSLAHTLTLTPLSHHLTPHLQGGGTFFEASGRTHLIEQGDALFHCGGLRHAAASVTTGRRMLLVGFVDVRARPQ